MTPNQFCNSRCKNNAESSYSTEHTGQNPVGVVMRGVHQIWVLGEKVMQINWKLPTSPFQVVRLLRAAWISLSDNWDGREPFNGQNLLPDCYSWSWFQQWLLIIKGHLPKLPNGFPKAKERPRESLNLKGIFHCSSTNILRVEKINSSL